MTLMKLLEYDMLTVTCAERFWQLGRWRDA